MKGQDRLPWAVVLLANVMLAACGGPVASGRSAPRRYAQTMDSATSACLRNPACYTQVGDEAVLPWLARAASRVGSAAATLRLLEAAEIARAEQLLMECAKEANFEVNERMLGRGQRPTREQCEEVVGTDSQGNAVTRAMQLGSEKHRVALECVQKKLGATLPGSFSVEPRYLYDLKTGRVRWLDPEEVKLWLRDGQFYLLLGTLVPDVVLHGSGEPLKVQGVYDFKFPCPATKYPRWDTYPLKHPFAGKSQGLLYREALGKEVNTSMVHPNFGLIP